MGDDRPCNMKEIGTVHTKMFDGMMQEVKEVMYIPQLKRNFIFVGALKALSFEVSIENDVLKMTRGSTVVLKGADAITFIT